ncbi:MAG: hypothetical protein A3K68_06305 [Euryarchaeota archaeon RBG_16_68_13]|nr:MAG: hypothetical protein A3K68_06305 [Euryarchaeota archaeon RBG_16_68_13]
MRIDLVEFAPLSIPRKERFTIARGSSDVADLVFVSVHSGGVSGQGCAAPTDVTKETIPTVLESLKRLSHLLSGFEFDRPRQVADEMDKRLPANPSAKAAIDMAVYDIAARVAGKPLFEYLGGSRDRMPTDMTIGIMPAQAAVERTRRWVAAGFQSLKVKVGRDPKADLERLRAIRAAAGPAVELRVDGNQGYTWSQALSFARAARDLQVSVFEQPVSAEDLEGMRVLAEQSPIPVMADEMVLTPEDAKKLGWAKAARAVNLKLMKHGGLSRTMDVNTICESAGFPTMVGCMGEPQLSIAAGLHFALAHKNVRWLDLDSHFNLAADPTAGLTFEAGNLIAPRKPGLGIDVELPA